MVGVEDFRSFVERRFGTQDDMLGFQMAFDVTGDPEFPEKAAFEVARELGVSVTTHAGVWGATNDDGIRLMHEHGFMAPEHLRPRGDADRGLLQPDRRHRRLRVRVDRERAERRPGLPADLALRKHDIPVSLSMDTSVWWSGDLFAMRSTLGADRSREHLEAHAKQETVPPPPARRAGRRLGDPRRLKGARDGREDRQPRARQEGRRRARQERALAGHVPDPLHPYGHVAFQAQRGDVHTVLVNGRVVKHEGRLVGVDLAPRGARSRRPSSTRSDDRRRRVDELHAPRSETRILTNPYQYTR